MQEDAYSILLMILLVAGGCVGAYFLKNTLTRKAVIKVLEIFCQHNAVGIQGAKTLRELGLERPDFIKKATSPRDYKQQALQILLKQGIIYTNADGKVYLARETSGNIQ